MSACERFETDGVALLAAGKPLVGHFAECRDCRDARVAYAALIGILGAHQANVQPPPGWQDTVWRTLRERGSLAESVGRSRRLWLPAVLAAVLGLMVLVPRLFMPIEAPTMKVALERGEVRYRAVEVAVPGDRLTIEATARRGTKVEVRVYRNEGELVARCPGAGDCDVTKERVRLVVPLDGVGIYQPVLLYGTDPLPPPESGLDADCGAALAAGGEIDLGEEIVVR